MRNIYIGLSILCFALSGFITYKALNLPEKNPLDLPVKTLQKTISQLEQKLTNESTVSQINTQTLEDTVKKLERKLADKIARAQKDTQSTENTTAQLERKLTDKITDSQKNIQTLENTAKQLEQKRINKDNFSETGTPAPLKNVSQGKLNTGEPEKTKKIPTMLLGDIAFKLGQVALNENMEKFIEQSAQHILTFLPSCRVIVEGHADNEGAEEYNMDISYFRAKAVALEFEKQGISFKRISVIGYGDTRPIASNNTADGRAKNRRVVVRLIPEKKEI